MVSVLMSTYNEPLSYIQISIESILTQSYKDIELIIIIDNPAYTSLINLLNELASEDSRVKLLINE